MTTFNKMTKENEELLANIGPAVSRYDARDNAVQNLTIQFYNETGLGVDGEFTQIETESFDQAEEQAKTIPGWSEWMGEEVEYLFKDGEPMGKMVVSCRGQMYRAEMTVNGHFWEATNMAGLVKESGADKWLPTNSNLWKRGA